MDCNCFESETLKHMTVHRQHGSREQTILKIEFSPRWAVEALFDCPNSLFLQAKKLIKLYRDESPGVSRCFLKGEMALIDLGDSITSGQGGNSHTDAGGSLRFFFKIVSVPHALSLSPKY